jgi:hypothetical protein
MNPVKLKGKTSMDMLLMDDGGVVISEVSNPIVGLIRLLFG